MTRVEAIEQEVQKLSPDEFSELRHWILEQDWDRWDRQTAAAPPPGVEVTYLANEEPGETVTARQD